MFFNVNEESLYKEGSILSQIRGQNVLKIFFRIYVMLLARKTPLVLHYGLHENEFDSWE